MAFASLLATDGSAIHFCTVRGVRLCNFGIADLVWADR